MIIASLSSQLGNMMFQYAAIKTIAQEKGVDFRFLRIPNTSFLNSTDAKYGSELTTIFAIPEEEQIYTLPPGYTTYEELPPHQRNYDGYLQDVYKHISDNTIVRGFFINPEIFKHNIATVRKWFSFPKEPVEKAQRFIQSVKTGNEDSKICVVHFRVGYDYFSLGYKLHKSYWIRAGKEVMMQHPDVKFICVYDKYTSDVKAFMKKFPAYQYHGSLVDDLSMIAQADINIVCNSSFSIMGALLNPHSLLVVCPSIYPTPFGSRPDDTYAKSWHQIPNTKRDLASRIAWNLRKITKSILPTSVIKKLLRK